MTWRELLIGCVVACALTVASVLATRPAAIESDVRHPFEVTRLVFD